eukprot:72990_1
MPCLFCMYTYDLIKPQPPKPNTKRKRSKDDHVSDRALHVRLYGIHISTLVCILFAFFAGILTFGNNLNMFTSACSVITIALNICWIIAKISVYNVALLRLECIFWGTQYVPNKRFLIAMYLLINGVFIISFLYSLAHIKSKLYNAPGEPGWCLYIIPTFVIFLPASLDLVVTPIAFILFVKPLHQLLTVAHDQDQDIKQLVTKYVLLSLIGIFSNVFSSIWFGVTDIVFFNDIDILINPFCLFLMQTTRWNVYYCLCKCCHNSCNRWLHKTDEMDSDNASNRDRDNEDTTRIETETAKSWYEDPVKPTAVSTVTVTGVTHIENENEIDGTCNQEEFDSQRTTTSDLERGEFKRKYRITPDKILTI